MTTRYALLLAAFPLLSTANAQVFTDFEDGNIEQWLVEADGVPSLDTINGLPDNCLRITDEVLSEINLLVLPQTYIGDWSAATAEDSISFDLFNHSGGTYLPDGDGLVELVGPGGRARTSAVFDAVQDVWSHQAFALDTTDWTLVSGDWAQLLASIEFVRVRTEFVTGNEYTLVDNVRLTLTPLVQPLNGTVCSTWDTIGNFDGWSFQNVANIEVSMSQGNPPGSVRLGDAGNALTYAVAAPKFRGDWSAFDGEATVTFDLYLQTSSANYYAKEYLLKISGPGGSAKFITNDSITALTVNQWRGYEVLIEEGSWEILTGSWSGLLDFVSEIRLELEFIQGTGETCFLDNFCLNAPDNNAVGSIVDTDRPMVFPNPFSDMLTVQSPGNGPHHLQIVDMTGRTVFAQRIPTTKSIDLSGLSNGAYTAFFRNELQRMHCVTLIKQ